MLRVCTRILKAGNILTTKSSHTNINCMLMKKTNKNNKQNKKPIKKKKNFKLHTSLTSVKKKYKKITQ